MCLSIPGRVVQITDAEPLTRRGKVDFGGIAKEINLVFVPEAQVGDFVLVHVGFAIGRIDGREAAYLKEVT